MAGNTREEQRVFSRLIFAESGGFMMRTTGCRVFYISLTLVLSVVLAPSQELRHGSPHLPSHRDSQAAKDQDEVAAEQSLWDSIKESSDPREFKTFLAKSPRGRFSDEGRSRLRALRAADEDYVTLSKKRARVARAWAEAEKWIQRRADIIPNLVAVARKAGVGEPERFGQVAEARSRLINATGAAPQGEGGDKTPEQRQAVIEAANGFGGTLGLLQGEQEAYPQLRSNELFKNVQEELARIENRINVARAVYNALVRDYNAARHRARKADAAERHGFVEEPYFKAEMDRPVPPAY